MEDSMTLAAFLCGLLIVGLFFAMLSGSPSEEEPE
jgi:hypothetical protein